MGGKPSSAAEARAAAARRGADEALMLAAMNGQRSRGATREELQEALKRLAQALIADAEHTKFHFDRRMSERVARQIGLQSPRTLVELARRGEPLTDEEAAETGAMLLATGRARQKALPSTGARYNRYEDLDDAELAEVVAQDATEVYAPKFVALVMREAITSHPGHLAASLARRRRAGRKGQLQLRGKGGSYVMQKLGLRTPAGAGAP